MRRISSFIQSKTGYDPLLLYAALFSGGEGDFRENRGDFAEMRGGA